MKTNLELYRGAMDGNRWLQVTPRRECSFFVTNRQTLYHNIYIIIIIIIISHYKSTAERRPSPIPSTTVYTVLISAKLLLHTFQSRLSILYLVFFYFVSRYMGASLLVFCPSIIVHPSYMSCPLPFLLFNHLYNVFYFSLFSYPGRSFPIC